jgi:opacity protein-like surface antigen
MKDHKLMIIRLLLSGLFLTLATMSAPAQDTSGFYVRGDLGWAFASDASIRDITIDPTGATSFPNLCNGGAPNICGLQVDDIGDSGSLSLGVGYRFTDNYRMDLTGGFRPAFELDDSITTAALTEDTYSAAISTTTIMLSGYYDISMSDSKVKPYIGVGLGWSRNEIEMTAVTNPLGGPLYRTYGGDTKQSVAWQLNAGVGIPLRGSRAIMDIGYKYVDAGELDSGPSTVSGTAGGAFGPFPFDGVTGDIAFHEISIGIRY